MNDSKEFYQAIEATKSRINALPQAKRTLLLCSALPYWPGTIESIEVHQVAWNLHANFCADTLEILSNFNLIN